MQAINPVPNNRANKFFDLEKTNDKMRLSAVFGDGGILDSYLNELQLFFAHFNSIPNSIQEEDLDCKKANNWFIENYAAEVKEHLASSIVFRRGDDAFPNQNDYFPVLSGSFFSH